MKRLFLALPALLLVFIFNSSVSATGDPKVQKSLIVSTEWLAKHLNDDSLVLLQVGEKQLETALRLIAISGNRPACSTSSRATSVMKRICTMARLKTGATGRNCRWKEI